jgi:toxin ParE1/3/4
MPNIVTRSEAAQRDLEGHVDYFDERSREVAQRYLHAVSKTFDFLAANREAGQLCHFNNAATEGLRVWPVESFRNYLVFFRPTDDGVVIERVLHGARDIDALFGDGA